jgi:hypothetical protein
MNERTNERTVTSATECRLHDTVSSPRLGVRCCLCGPGRNNVSSVCLGVETLGLYHQLYGYKIVNVQIMSLSCTHSHRYLGTTPLRHKGGGHTASRIPNHSLDRVSGQFVDPPILTPAKSPRYQLDRRVGWAQGLVFTLWREVSALVGNRTPIPRT